MLQQGLSPSSSQPISSPNSPQPPNLPLRIRIQRHRYLENMAIHLELIAGMVGWAWLTAMIVLLRPPYPNELATYMKIVCAGLLTQVVARVLSRIVRLEYEGQQWL